MLCLCCVGISLLPAGRDREGISRVWLSPVFKNVFIRINFAFDFKKNVFPFTRFDFYLVLLVKNENRYGYFRLHGRFDLSSAGRRGGRGRTEGVRDVVTGK